MTASQNFDFKFLNKNKVVSFQAADWQKIRHYDYPDYGRSPLEITSETRERILKRLTFLYGEVEAAKYLPELERIMRVYYAHKPPEAIHQEVQLIPRDRFTQEDIILITYGDLLRSKGSSPLASLVRILEKVPSFKKAINTLHILPFFPYSSDRGFSVVDFRTVDPDLGSWQDIAKISDSYRLMFDAVCNHTSAKSKAFQKLLSGNPEYEGVAIVYDSPEQLSSEDRQKIVRPRTSNLLTEYQSINGSIWVWTTFSADQIDLNYANPKVLLWVIETLLLYARRGANIIRLDAVTYLWKILGTACANLPQTHETIKLFRDVFNVVAPGVALITETNIPHEQNIAYFGNGYDEAQMVYNFALPPLVLHTFYQADATALSQWADNLEFPSNACTYLNILDTHDGIGLMGVKNILKPEEINFLVSKAREHGAFVSYRTGANGQDEPYEINSTWYSALNFDSGDESQSLQIQRYVASRSIALVLKGVPGIYLHGLIGTSNDIDTVIKTKSKRDINRQIIEESALVEQLQAPDSKLAQLSKVLGRLLEIRVRHKAFHPQGNQQIFSLAPQCFTVLRTSLDEQEHILSVVNISPEICSLTIPLEKLDFIMSSQVSYEIASGSYWYDLIKGRTWRVDKQHISLVLQPYDILWLIPDFELEQCIEK